jgi:hypothetical protein
MEFARPETLGYIHSFNELVSYGNNFVTEAKYNGWAVGVAKEGVPITRHHKPLSPNQVKEVSSTLDELRSKIDWSFCEMVHCEFMLITPESCPTNTIIVHDCMGGPSSEYPLFDRKAWMWLGLEPPILHAGNIMCVIPDEGLYVPKRVANVLNPYLTTEVEQNIHHSSTQRFLRDQVIFNQMTDELFYEGFVHKKISAKYGQKNAWFKQRIQNQLLIKEVLEHV